MNDKVKRDQEEYLEFLRSWRDEIEKAMSKASYQEIEERRKREADEFAKL